MDDMDKIKAKELSWKNKFPAIHKDMDFSKYLKNSKNHLDFGCGFGIVTYLLAKKYPKTTFYGFDIDKKMVSLAKNKYALKNLVFDSNKKIKYDSISCMYVLHHVENPGLALKELHNKLNNKGKVLILEFRKNNKTKFRELYNKKERPETFEEFYKVHNIWNKEQFEQLCKTAGFKTLILKDFDDFWFIYVGEK